MAHSKITKNIRNSCGGAWNSERRIAQYYCKLTTFFFGSIQFQGAAWVRPWHRGPCDTPNPNSQPEIMVGSLKKTYASEKSWRNPVTLHNTWLFGETHQHLFLIVWGFRAVFNRSWFWERGIHLTTSAVDQHQPFDPSREVHRVLEQVSTRHFCASFMDSQHLEA